MGDQVAHASIIYLKKKILSFVTTWMNLEGILLSEIRQRKTNSSWHYLYVDSGKSLTHGNRAEMWLQRVGRNRERFVKGYKLSFIR